MKPRDLWACKRCLFCPTHIEEISAARVRPAYSQEEMDQVIERTQRETIAACANHCAPALAYILDARKYVREINGYGTPEACAQVLAREFDRVARERVAWEMGQPPIGLTLAERAALERGESPRQAKAFATYKTALEWLMLTKRLPHSNNTESKARYEQMLQAEATVAKAEEELQAAIIDAMPDEDESPMPSHTDTKGTDK